MLYIGSHVSFTKKTQLLGSLDEALSYGSNAFMFYTGAPQNTRRDDIDDNITKEALDKMKDNNISIDNVIVHAPYIVNLANNNDEDKYKFSYTFLRKEMDRCERIGIKYMVLHPGSALDLDRKYAMDNIINGLNIILKEDDTTTILLETMAGKGSELGITTDELKYMIDNIKLNDKLGVCIDTCHLNDAGVDISKFDEYLDDFDKKIGLDKIRCVHINDSKNELGARKDRHENIGLGTISFDALINVIYNPRLDNIPKILETPYVNKEYAPYKQEIEMIRNKVFNPNLYDDIISFYKEGE